MRRLLLENRPPAGLLGGGTASGMRGHCLRNTVHESARSTASHSTPLFGQACARRGKDRQRIEGLTVLVLALLER